MRSRVVLLTVTAACAAATLPASGAAATATHIVVLSPGTGLKPAQAAEEARRAGAQVRHVYHHALRGYAARLDASLLARLARDARIASIVRDTPLTLSATQTAPPSWGVDRLDQRNLPLSGSYSYNATGAGVDAYIIDTGIRLTHSDFGGRAVSGVDLINGGGVEDCNGHGTHVAGTVGGNLYGVAKQARLVGVRIGECGSSLSTATAIAGIDWVTGNHQPGQPAVANMSFGGGTNSTMDTAVRNMVADGVTAVIAAGNGNVLGMADNACNQSPARVAEALTVSSTDTADRKVSYANTGTCVDLFAPGRGIVSASHASDTGAATMEGTSMAAPHVAGAAAMYLQTSPSATPAQTHSAINSNATPGVVTSPGSGTPNRLLYTSFIGAPSGNAAPSAGFTQSCSGMSCSFSDTSTDSDGTIASRSWAFGDGATSTAASPSHTYATAGSYTVTLTVTDDDGATATTSQTVTAGSGGDPDPGTPTLTNGQPLGATNGAAGTWQYFKISVPAGRSQLRVVLDGQPCAVLGCNPDLDTFVRRGAKPTASAYDCKQETGSSDETCTLTNPAAGWWYVGIYVYSGSSRTYTVTATH